MQSNAIRPDQQWHPPRCNIFPWTLARQPPWEPVADDRLTAHLIDARLQLGHGKLLQLCDQIDLAKISSGDLPPFMDNIPQTTWRWLSSCVF